MSRGDYDDRDDRDRYDDDRDYRRRDPDEARRKVSAPAVMLIISGLIGLLLEVMAVVGAFTNPTAGAEFYEKYVIDPQPEGAQKEQLKAEFERQKADMRSDKPLNLASYGLGALLNLLTVIGGFKMKGLSGYGLSMTGAITAIVPFGGCCCLTTPVGVWALIVLLNPVVKQAFGVGRRAEPEDDYDRRDDRDRDDRR